MTGIAPAIDLPLIGNPPPHSPWRAQLSLQFRADAGRTRLAARQHHGPLIVQRPFYPEDGVCHVYLVHPPGGIVGGDELRLIAHAEPDSQVLITTPAATRFYRAGPHPDARLQQQLHVADAQLEWLPQETILFDGAAAICHTDVQLSGRSTFIGWEMFCLGRPACGEQFATGRLRQDLRLSVDGQPLLFDRLRLTGSAPALNAPWGLAGAAAFGTLLAWPAQAQDVAALRECSSPEVRCTVTLVDRVLHCRALAAQGEPLRRHFTRLWAALRPRLLQRKAVMPRIWAT
jgi:urease accessory protein